MSEDPKESRRSFQTRALADMLPRLVRRALGRRGFAETRIVTHWREIVGEALAKHTLPERIAFPRGARDGGNLHLLAEGGFALELQHLQPLLIERVNAFFGYGAIARVTIVQAPIPRSARRRARPKKRPQIARGEGLANALRRLEQGIENLDDERDGGRSA